MNLQYISDQNGIPKSVVIPIEDWNRIKEKYSGLEKELQDDFLLTDKMKKVLDQRLEEDKSTYTSARKSLNKIRAKHGL